MRAPRTYDGIPVLAQSMWVSLERDGDRYRMDLETLAARKRDARREGRPTVKVWLEPHIPKRHRPKEEQGL